MKTVFGTCVLCLVLIAVAAPVHPSDDPAARAVGAADRRAGSLSGNLEKMDFQPNCRCSDIAHTGAFRANRLQYVQTPEFAQAVQMLASGSSRYSPRYARDLPLTTWRSFATELRQRSAADAGEAVGPTASAVSYDVQTGNGGLCFLGVEERLIPALLYLASLEYRSWPGHADVTPVFPRIFRAATSELDARIGEKRRMAGEFAKRAAAIRARIAEAERRGPGSCAPAEIARAKSELNSACRDALGVRSSLQETDMAFARAERAAEQLLPR